MAKTTTFLLCRLAHLATFTALLALTGCRGFPHEGEQEYFKGCRDFIGKEFSVVLASGKHCTTNDVCVTGPACFNFKNGKHLLGDGAKITWRGETEFEGPAKIDGAPLSAFQNR